MQLQATVQDSQLQAKWDAYFQTIEADVNQAVLDYDKDNVSLYVDFEDVQLRDPELADLLLHRPAHALRVGAAAMHQVPVAVEPRPRLHLRFHNLPDKPTPSNPNPDSDLRLLPRDLRARHLGKLLAVRGIVLTIRPVRPMIHEACFECKFCANLEFIVQDDDHFLMEPIACSACEKTGPWRLRDEDCKMVDHQSIILQESPDSSRGGAQVFEVEVHLRDDLVQTLIVGDDVTINGILTTKARRENKARKLDSDMLLMAVSFEKAVPEEEDLLPTAEERDFFHKIAERDDCHTVLAQSLGHGTLAGLDAVRMAAMFSLAGAPTYRQPDGSYRRGEIHLLIVGDPGTAKTKLQDLVERIARRVQRVDAMSVSGPGLSAGVERDGAEGKWILRAGALPMADTGVILIDELSHMSKEDLGYLQTALSDGVVRLTKIAKCSLTARVTCIATMNPAMGDRFDASLPRAQQIGLTPAVKSRFALVFCLVDGPEGEEDIARMMLGLHEAATSDLPVLDYELLRKYVAYTHTINPVLDQASKEAILGYWLKMRRQTRLNQAFDPRQVADLENLTLASARLALRSESRVHDVHRAIDLYEASLRSSEVLTDHGIDGDLFRFGRPKAQSDRMKEVYEAVEEICLADRNAGGLGVADEEQLVKVLVDMGHDDHQIRKDLLTLAKNNSVYAKGGSGKWAPL